MTDKQILKKAFEKADKNGYKVNLKHSVVGEMPIEKVIEYGIYYKILFDHSFCGAIFGNEVVDENGKPFTPKFKATKYFFVKNKRLVINMQGKLPAWQYHIQKMALAKNPIKYLENFV